MAKQDMEDKLQRFRTAVFQEVEASIAKEDALASQKQEQELAEYETQLDNQYHKRLEESKALLEQKYQKQASQAQLDAGKAELLCRKQALEQLEAGAKEKIMAYIETKEYQQKLVEAVKSFENKYAGREFTLRVRKQDAALLQKEFPKLTITEDKQMRLGGFLAMLGKEGLCIDASIALRLSNALEEAAAWL